MTPHLYRQSMPNSWHLLGTLLDEGPVEGTTFRKIQFPVFNRQNKKTLNTHTDANACCIDSYIKLLMTWLQLIFESSPVKQTTTQQYSFIRRHTKPHQRNTTVAHYKCTVLGWRCNRDVPHCRMANIAATTGTTCCFTTRILITIL